MKYLHSFGDSGMLVRASHFGDGTTEGGTQPCVSVRTELPPDWIREYPLQCVPLHHVAIDRDPQVSCEGVRLRESRSSTVVSWYPLDACRWCLRSYDIAQIARHLASRRCTTVRSWCRAWLKGYCPIRSRYRGRATNDLIAAGDDVVGPVAQESIAWVKRSAYVSVVQSVDCWVDWWCRHVIGRDGERSLCDGVVMPLPRLAGVAVLVGKRKPMRAALRREMLAIARYEPLNNWRETVLQFVRAPDYALPEIDLAHR